jgi:hypothetical protein
MQMLQLSMFIDVVHGAQWLCAPTRALLACKPRFGVHGLLYLFIYLLFMYMQ